MKSKITLILILALFVVSCVSYTRPMNSLRISSGNPATITVERDYLIAVAVPHVFMVDGENFYIISAGDSFSFRIDPGIHLFGVKYWGWSLNPARPKTNDMRLSVLAGEIYNLMIESYFTGPRLRLIN